MENKEFVFSATIKGSPLSINQYLVPVNSPGSKYPTLKESFKAKQWKKDFVKIIKIEMERQGFDGSVTGDGIWIMEVDFILSRKSTDQNNLWKVLCDACVMGGLLVDDKNLLVTTSYIAYSSTNPQFTIRLRKSPQIGIFTDEHDLESFKNVNCSNCSKNCDKCGVMKKAIGGYITEDIVGGKCLKIKNRTSKR